MPPVLQPTRDSGRAKVPITRRHFLLGGAAVVTAGMIGSSEGERHWIEIVYREIRIRELPPSFDGFRIAQVSDIHFEQFSEGFFVHRAVELVNQLKPNLVALTGDFITADEHKWINNARHASACAEILSGLECKDRLASLGNHDALAASRVISALSHSGIEVLRNNYTSLDRGGDKLWLAGLDDAYFGGADPAKTMPPRKKDQPVVLLGHEPDFADKIRPFHQKDGTSTVDLMLAGHSHGGQIRLPGLTHFFLPEMGRKYIQGLFDFGGMQLYVNRGLGTVHLPLRFFCRPEITLLTLRRA